MRPINIIVFEPRQERWAGLRRELAAADLCAVLVDREFFEGDLSAMAIGAGEAHPILLSATEDTLDYIRALRAAQCDNPILVLRDFRNSMETTEALDAGADDDLVVPLKARELRSRINCIRRRASGHAAQSVTIGEVTAYFDGRDPEIGGRAVKLSAREHAIFTHLALHAHRVVNKASIYDAVYGMGDGQPLDNVIDVYVCKLRKKLCSASASGWPYIETLRGRGYKLSAPAAATAPARNAGRLMLATSNVHGALSA